MLSSALYACVLLLALTLAFARGELAERRSAVIILLGNGGTIAVLVASSGTDYSYVSATYVLIDVCGAAALCALAVSRPSWMSVLLASFQINGTLGHLVKLISPETIDISYAVLLRVWGWPMVLTMLLAHWTPGLRHVLRQSDLMRAPSWLRPPPPQRSKNHARAADSIAASRVAKRIEANEYKQEVVVPPDLQEIGPNRSCEVGEANERPQKLQGLGRAKITSVGQRVMRTKRRGSQNAY